ncbi:MAG: hypothetical protein V7L03_04170 [Nostoc sp.]
MAQNDSQPQPTELLANQLLNIRTFSLQGALTGLQHKGLIYNAEPGYQLALPLLALWLRQQLS